MSVDMTGQTLLVRQGWPRDGSGQYVGSNPNAGGGTSGGTAALGWSAPSGLADGNTLTITTDGTYDFGAAPRIATAGFGQGFLETASLDTALTDITDPISGETWQYENAVTNGRTPNRFVASIDGVRAFHQTHAGYSDGAGFGFFGWDTGSTIADGERILVSSWVKADVSAFAIDANDDPLLATQWKSWRFRDEIFFDSTNGYSQGNSGYWKAWGYRTDTYGDRWLADDEGEFTNYNANGSASNALDISHPTYDNKWTRTDLLLRPYIDADGLIRTRMQKPVDASAVTVKTVNNFQLLDSTHPRRWRTIQEQSYIKDIKDLDLYITDYYIQVGSYARFELADGATPATSTDSKILPPDTASWSNNSATVHLYKQMFSDYSGKYLHYYDIDDNFVTGVAL